MVDVGRVVLGLVCLLSSLAALPLYRDSLPNGLVVLTYEDHRLPLVHMALVCRSGATYDPADKAGVSNLTAGLLVRGSKTMSGDSVSSLTEYLGARLYAGADYDNAVINLQMLAKDLGTGLDLLVDAVRNPAFEPKEFASMRDQAVEDARWQLEFSRALAENELNRLLFAGHPYGRPSDGDTGSLRRLTRDDLTAFHKAHYVPGNCFVVAVGDLDRTGFVNRVRARLGDWVPGAVPQPAVPALVTPARPKVKLINRPEMDQYYVAFGHPGIAMGDTDMLATRLMAQILGGGALASRMGDAVREEGGLAYDVRCSFDRRLLTGGFRASVQTARPKVAIEKMFHEIVLMRDGGAKPGELEEAANYLTGSFPLSYRSGDGKRARVHEQELYRFGMDWLERFPNDVRAVTLDAINAAARRHLRPGQYVMVVVGNVKKEDLGLSDVDWVD